MVEKNSWYVQVTDNDGITYYAKTSNLELLIEATSTKSCKEILCRREQDVNVSVYTDIDAMVKRRLART